VYSNLLTTVKWGPNEEDKSYVRSIKRYCFVRKYAAITVQLEIFILQYIDWCVLIIWTFIVNPLLLLLLLLLVVVVVLHEHLR